MKSWISRLRPGDLVIASQGVGEPMSLLEDLLASAPPGIELFVGLSHTEVLQRPSPLPLLSFGGLGPLGRVPACERLKIIPANFGDLPQILRQRSHELVLLIQVTQADAAETHGFGMAVDYNIELLSEARMVVAEVNTLLPDTDAPRIPASAINEMIPVSRAPAIVSFSQPGTAQYAIARQIATLIPDGATVQLGIGTVPSALGRELAVKRNLAVHSTLAGDWMLELARGGALRDEPDAIVISEAAGSADLYDFVARSGVRLQSPRAVIGAAASGEIKGLIAVNSALQVDLSGQVNAEETSAGFIGAIGGQSEYMRAAQRSHGGCAIIGLPASAGGRSRIVSALDPPTVTTARSYVDVIVTEYGIADLRGRTLDERADLLTAIASPEHRSNLRKGRT